MTESTATQPGLRLSAFKEKTETQAMCTEMSALREALSTEHRYTLPNVLQRGDYYKPLLSQIHNVQLPYSYCQTRITQKILRYDDSE